MTQKEDLLTPVEVAAITRTAVDTLRWWRHVGRGPRSFKIGRKVVYERAEVMRWIAEERRRTGGAA
jgi:predicted DNA-binding transcriptional regulator AlpA